MRHAADHVVLFILKSRIYGSFAASTCALMKYDIQSDILIPSLDFILASDLTPSNAAALSDSFNPAICANTWFTEAFANGPIPNLAPAFSSFLFIWYDIEFS